MDVVALPSEMPFVTGPYCDINPLYLAYITLRVQL